MDNITATRSKNLSDSCSWYHSMGDKVAFVAYDVIMPFHVLAGLFGYTLCFLVFKKKAKQETAFAYQIILVCSQTVEVLTYAVYVATLYWFSGAEDGIGAVWFRSSYACMWFTAHFSFPLVNFFITTSLLLTLATAIDRVFALGRPFEYKMIKHRKHQLVAGAICLTVGVSSSIFDCFRFYPTLDKDSGLLYRIALDSEYTGSLTANALSHLRNAIRIFSTLSLVAADAAMIVMYKRHLRKVGTMTSLSNADSKRKNAQQKVLILLAVSESTFNFLSMTALSAYFTALFASPTFYDCQSHFYASLVDALVEIFDICDFYVVFAVSKQFRGMVADAVPCMKRFIT